MKQLMKRSAAAMMAVVMFMLIIQVPTKADTLWASWGGGQDVVLPGGTIDFAIYVSPAYSYQEVMIDVCNSRGAVVYSFSLGQKSTSSYSSQDSYRETAWYRNAGDTTPGVYTLKWYVKYWSNSAWHNSSYLGSHSIRVISSSTYGWISHNGNWYYRKPTGSFAYGKQTIDGYTYYFESETYSAAHSKYQMYTNEMVLISSSVGYNYFGNDGRACSKWVDMGLGDWMYFGDDGCEYTGWVKSGGSWYYIEDGWMARDYWKMGSNGQYCLLGHNGVMATGWYQIGDEWHLFGADGYEKLGWAQDGGKWYYFDNYSGAMLSGWQKIDGNWYYLGNAMATGWKQISGTWYYFGSNGIMNTGWQKIDGSWYYFGSDGAMRSGWQKIDGTWYYFNNTMATGWKMINGTWYYFQSNGAMVSGGSYYIDGQYYSFASSGALIK